jgi:DNA repair protein RecO
MEIADKTTGCGDKDESIYNLLISAVNSLGSVNNEISFALFFIARYLCVQGLLPEIEGCTSCGEKSFKSFSMNNRNLNLLCPGCTGKDDLIIDSSALNYFIRSTWEKYSSIDHCTYRENDIHSLLRVITEFIEQYYSVTIKSGDMLLNSPAC